MQPGVCGAKRGTPSLAGASLLLARSLSTLSPLILSLLILAIDSVWAAVRRHLSIRLRASRRARISTQPPRGNSPRGSRLSRRIEPGGICGHSPKSARDPSAAAATIGRATICARNSKTSASRSSPGKWTTRTQRRRSSGAGAPETRVTNLSAIIPGTRSQDRFLLVAPFDSRSYDDFEFIGANDGASGAAVVLEIARSIAADPLLYATEIVFLDGESPFPSPDDQGAFTGRSAAWGWPRAFKKRASPEFA